MLHPCIQTSNKDQTENAAIEKVLRTNIYWKVAALLQDLDFEDERILLLKPRRADIIAAAMQFLDKPLGFPKFQ